MHASFLRLRRRSARRPVAARLVLAVGLLAARQPARATPYTWMGGGTDDKWSSAGNWQNGVPVSSQDTALVFAGNSRLQPVDDIASNFALNSLGFAAGAGAFTLNGAGNSDMLVFRTSSGGALPTLTQNAASTETVNLGLQLNNDLTVGGTGTGQLILAGVIGGGALTMAGSGTTVLTGTNQYAGSTTFAAGTLTAGNAQALGAGGTLSFTGGTLQYGSGNQADYSRRFSTAATQAYSIDTNGQNVTFATGLNSAGGSLTKLGAGTLTLSGASTYTGTTSVTGGTLTVGTGGSLSGGDNLGVDKGGTLAISGTGSVSLASGKALVLYGAGGTTATATLSGTGSLSTGEADIGYNGAGVFTQSGGSFTTTGHWLILGLNANSDPFINTSGTYNLNGGTLTTGAVISGANGTNGTNGTSTFNFGGGTLSPATSSALFFQGLTKANVQAGGAKIDTNGFDVTVAQNLVHDTTAGAPATDGGLTKLGAGTLTLTGANTYTGATTISAGTLQVGGGGTTGTLGTSTSAITDSGALAFNRSDNVTLANAISGTGRLAQAGAGTLTLTGASTYTGATSVTAGTLAVGTGGSLTGGGNLNVDTGGTLAINGTGSVSLASGRGLTLAGTVGSTASATLGGTGSLSTSTAYVGLDGAGIFSQTGGSFTTTGYTLFLGTGSGSSGTYTLSGGTLTTGRTQVSQYANTDTFTQSGGTHTTGTLGLSAGSPSSVGTYNLNGGTLNTGQVASSIPVAEGTSTFNFNGGTLQAGAASTTFMQGLTKANVQAGGARIDTNGFNVTVAQNLVHDTASGAAAADGGLTKLGAGTLILSASNTFTGNTTVNAGTLDLANSLALQNSTLASSNGSLVFDAGVSGNAFTLGGLSGSANLVLANNAATPAAVALSVGGNNASTTYSGALSGAGSLTKLGTGTLTLTGTNTFTGGTAFAGGVLDAGSAGALGSSGALSFTGGTLQYSANNTTDYSGRFLQSANQAYSVDTNGQNVAFASGLNSAGGSLTKLGAGTLTLAGTNTFTGPVNINAGTLAVASESNLGAATSPLTVGGGGQLQFTASATLTRTYNLGVSTLGIGGGLTLTFGSGSVVSGGLLAGPGTDALGNGSTLNAVTTFANSTLIQTDGGTATLNAATIRGTLNQSPAGTLNVANTTVTSAGKLNVSGTVNTSGVELDGVTTVNGGGTVANAGSSLVLGGGSRTTVNAGGTLSTATGTSIELNGALLVNNGTQSGALNVNFGSQARGSGTFGDVSVGQGGRFGNNGVSGGGNSANGLTVIHLSGGDGLARTTLVGAQLMAAPGTVNVNSLTLGSGSVFDCNVQDAQGAAGSGYDTTHASGMLTLSASTAAGSQITISLASLNSGGMAGQAANFDPARSYAFVLVSADGGIAGYNPAEFVVDASGFQNATNGGSFFVVQQGNQLLLDYNAVPEPSTGGYLVGFGGIGLLAAYRRRSLRRA